MQAVTITQITAPELEALINTSIRNALSHLAQNIPTQPLDNWYDIDQLRGYLPEKPAKATVYGWVHSAVIPHHKKGKKLYFLKSEIDAWLKDGRKKTVSEMESEADTYLATAKMRG